MIFLIGENRGIWAAPANAAPFQATANSLRSGSKEGVMSPGRPGRSPLASIHETARPNVLRTIGQMPRRDRDLRGQAWRIPSNPWGLGRRGKPAGSCGVAAAPGVRPFLSDDSGVVAVDHPASPTRKRLEKGTVDRFGGTGDRTPAARPGFNFSPSASAAMTDDEWPILDPVKLQAAFASMPSVRDFYAADAGMQTEIMSHWSDRRANGDEFEQNAADTRIWVVGCEDRYETVLAREDYLDVVTEDQNR